MRDFEDQGCFVEQSLLSEHDFNPIKNAILEQIQKHCDVNDIQDEHWVTFAMKNPHVITGIYDSLRDSTLLHALGQNSKITDIVGQLIDQPVLYKKIPLRIDVPFENKELAFWHQDDFYVHGNSSEITVWIPLQETLAHNGALSVMKASHKNGPIPHTLQVGKKMLPTNIYHNLINIVEMSEGDCLFFGSYLVHQSNLNISNKIRYSIQLRYSSLTAGKQSEQMGGTLNV